jgi:hypothetical protein
MSLQKSVRIIYRYSQDPHSEIPELSGRYELLFVMGLDGWMESDKLTEIYQLQFEKPASDPIHFSAMEDLKSFSLNIAKELGAYEAHIISSVDYNIGLQSTHDKNEFIDLFRHFGTVLKNDQALKGFNLKKLNPFSKG